MDQATHGSAQAGVGAGPKPGSPGALARLLRGFGLSFSEISIHMPKRHPRTIKKDCVGIERGQLLPVRTPDGQPSTDDWESRPREWSGLQSETRRDRRHNGKQMPRLEPTNDSLDLDAEEGA